MLLTACSHFRRSFLGHGFGIIPASGSFASSAAFRKSIALDPSYSLAHRFLGIVLAHTTRHEEASLAIRHARDLDPLNATNHALSAQVTFVARDYSGAVQFAQQAITIDPEFWIG